MIKSTIENAYIKLNLYGGNGKNKTEWCHRVIIKVYVCELNIEIIKKYATEFIWNMTEKDFYIWVIIIFD